MWAAGVALYTLTTHTFLCNCLHKLFFFRHFKTFHFDIMCTIYVCDPVSTSGLIKLSFCVQFHACGHFANDNFHKFGHTHNVISIQHLNPCKHMVSGNLAQCTGNDVMCKRSIPRIIFLSLNANAKPIFFCLCTVHTDRRHNVYDVYVFSSVCKYILRTWSYLEFDWLPRTQLVDISHSHI